MLDPDQDSMNPDPKHWILHPSIFFVSTYEEEHLVWLFAIDFYFDIHV